MINGDRLSSDALPADSAKASNIPHANRLTRWGAVLLSAVIILLIPVPDGITPQAWRMLAIFVATIVGSIVHPLPGGAVVLIGLSTAIFTQALPLNRALTGYADPIVWLVLAAFFMSRGMIKTGLGRRIAFLFIRAIGHNSLGLGYALISTDFVLASFIPSNAARSGGIIFPIATSLAQAYDSKPGPTAGRLGAFLLKLIYQSDVIICAMFLTGQASNALIAGFAKQVANIDLSYSRWILAAFVPGLVSLAVVPPLLYRIFPPEIKKTPAAAEFASEELKRMGPMKGSEKIMLAVFALVAGLWMSSSWLSIHYALVALLGICVLLVSGVLHWEDILAERGAWDVFIWYGGLIKMAEAINEYGLTKRFAEASSNIISGWPWLAALIVLLLIYFYAHYGFASITAHATAMFMPFVAVAIAAGAPPYLAVLSFAFLSNLDAGLTHYGTTPAPIYFGSGYIGQGTWWRLGLLISIVNIPIWLIVGFIWWRLLGLWS